MAQPTDPAELAKVQAQDAYNAAAAVIDKLLDIFPNPTWNSTRTDTWLIDVRVPDLPMDLVMFAHTEFNELVERVRDYDLDVVPLPVCRTQAKRSKATVSPSHLHQDAAATHSRMTTPAPLPSVSKPMTPVLATPKHVPPATLTKPTPAPQLQVTPKPTASTLVTPMMLAAPSLVEKTTGASQPTTQRKNHTATRFDYAYAMQSYGFPRNHTDVSYFVKTIARISDILTTDEITHSIVDYGYK
ncbi:hypothetical protein EDD85DRAFT_790267 [Armillaria nabsnona]|nr:hypothetical protein EDD85DRAFT_790267 [Armillaria nabsnona]